MKSITYLLVSLLLVIIVWAMPSTVQAGCCYCLGPMGSQSFTALDELDCDNRCSFYSSYDADELYDEATRKCVDAPEVCFWNTKYTECADGNDVANSGLVAYNALEPKCQKTVGTRPANTWVSPDYPCCCFKGDPSQVVLFTTKTNSNTNTGWGGKPRTWASVEHVVETPKNPLVYANYRPENVIGRIIGVAMTIMGSIALAMFIYGGFMWMTAAGDGAKVTKAVHTLVWSTFGLIVIFLAYILTNFVFQIASSV